MRVLSSAYVVWIVGATLIGVSCTTNSTEADPWAGVSLSPIGITTSGDDSCESHACAPRSVINACMLVNSADAVVLARVVEQGEPVWEQNCSAMPYASDHAFSELEVLEVLGGREVPGRLSAIQVKAPWASTVRFLEEGEVVVANIRELDGLWHFGLQLLAEGFDSSVDITHDVSRVDIDLPTNTKELKNALARVFADFESVCPESQVVSEEELRGRVYRETCGAQQPEPADSGGDDGESSDE